MTTLPYTLALPERGPQMMLVLRCLDGDTIEAAFLLPVHLRVAGVNAPEHNTEAGRKAREAVQGLVAGKLLLADLRGREKYGRLMAEVALEGGGKLSDWLVEQGHAARWDGRGPRPLPASAQEAAPGPVTLLLGTVLVEVWPGHLRTTFADGTALDAAANTDPESVARAHALGYAGDTWQLSRDHEIVHLWLAQLLGWPVSPTLWTAARPGRPGSAAPGLREAEEVLVLAFQRWLRQGAWDDHLQPLVDAGFDLAALAGQARRILSRLP